MNNLVTSLCQAAIIANIGILLVGIFHDVPSLSVLSIINIALLSARFIIFKGEHER